MNEMMKKNMPWVYRLSWCGDDPDNPAIVLAVRKDLLNDYPVFSPDNIFIWGLKAELGLDTLYDCFNGDLKSGNFGFNNSFERIGNAETENGIKFLIRIPEIKKYTGAICEICGGTGEEKEYGRFCFPCHGEGEKWLYDWHSAFAVSASFTAFFSVMEYCFCNFSKNIKQMEMEEPQYLTIESQTSKGAHGCSFHGIISKFLRNRLAIATNLADGIFSRKIYESQVIKAMKITYQKMMKEKESLGWYDVSFSGGLIHLSCPGDACGIDPNLFYDDKEIGYRFSHHNIDNPAEQITLIAGLAKLCDDIS